MRPQEFLRISGFVIALAFLALPGALVPVSTRAAGVTVITHGLNGNVDGWVTGMAKAIAADQGLPGTNSTIYKLYLVPSGKGYNLAWSRLQGGIPSSTDSGEIIVTFDWSQVADGNSYNTFQVAPILETALLATNFISELNGHALAELPIHLIGHSRGGSLMCQTSLLLGTNGVWVDQLTTLDPHPLNNDGFTLDGILYSAVDAPCKTYANVIFHDNYWENIGYLVHGEKVSGAYIRQLTTLSGGYQNTGDGFYPHSNVHLWYHGTVDLNTPASDTEASIGEDERTNWWAAGETNGSAAGFYYSLIGGGNRLSSTQPLGPGFPAIVDGYNQNWDLGAGLSNPNRTALPSNKGVWPNLITLKISGAHTISPGEPLYTAFYYQYAGASNLTLQIGLDTDSNPFNGMGTLIYSNALPRTGAGSVYYYSNLEADPTNVPPGDYALCGKLSDGIHSRYLYAPEFVRIISNLQPPVLDIGKLDGGQLLIGIGGVAGETVVLEASTDLRNWTPLATNQLASERWDYTNSMAATPQFFRTRVER